MMSAAAVLLSLFCVLCYTGQNIFNKLYSVEYDRSPEAATPVFSIIYGLFTAVATFAYNGFHFRASPLTVVFALGCGIALFCFNLSLINASRSGPYAFQSMMMLFGNTLLPLAFSVLFWKETLTWAQILGIAVMLGAFMFFNCRGFTFAGAGKKYYFWVILLFFANGLYGIIMDSQQKLLHQTERSEMIILTFLVSALISVIYLLMTQRKKAPECFRMGKKNWIYALCSSACAAVAINILLLALRLVPAPVLYTVNNGGVLMGCALLGAVLFHEKLEKHMIAGLITAIAGLILLSI